MAERDCDTEQGQVSVYFDPKLTGDELKSIIYNGIPSQERHWPLLQNSLILCHQPFRGLRLSWNSPLSLLLSDKADLDEKMLLVSFLVAAGVELEEKKKQKRGQTVFTWFTM